MNINNDDNRDKNLITPEMEELIMEFVLNFWSHQINKILDGLGNSFEKEDLVERL